MYVCMSTGSTRSRQMPERTNSSGVILDSRFRSAAGAALPDEPEDEPASEEAVGGRLAAVDTALFCAVLGLKDPAAFWPGPGS